MVGESVSFSGLQGCSGNGTGVKCGDKFGIVKRVTCVLAVCVGQGATVSGIQGRRRVYMAIESDKLSA